MSVITKPPRQLEIADDVSNQPAVCAHCGLAVPDSLVDSGSSDQFCCQGCRTAYQLIYECGLQAFYAMAEQSAAASFAGRDSAKRFEHVDTPSFISTFGQTHENGVGEIRFALEGIHCAACVWLIEKLPQILPAVLEARVNWSKRTVDVRWQLADIKLSRVVQTLAELGYYPHPLRAGAQHQQAIVENRRQLIRLAVAGAAAGNNMLIAAALYLGMFQHMAASVEMLLRWSSCLVGLVSLLWPGQVFLRGAIAAIRTRTPHMDLPVALGLSVGGVAGLLHTISGRGEIYFDSLSVLVFLLLLGRWIQYRQQCRAADAIEMLHQLTPHMTRKLVDGEFVETPIDLIDQGDILEVRAGETIPVDGQLQVGDTSVDEAILTGESTPRIIRPGDAVSAGTLNLQDVIRVQALAVGSATRIARIVGLVEQSQRQKPQLVQWADRIGGYFVGIVIVLAVTVLSAWLLVEPSQAVDRAVALLIVACPCALALATPLAISVALGRAAQRRILDKTGTLTQGKMRMVDWIGDERYKPAVAAIEQTSSHPAAVAIHSGLRGEFAGSKDSFLQLSATDVSQSDAGGIRGCVAGEQFLLGSQTFLAKNQIAITDRFHPAAKAMIDKSLTPIFVAVNGQVVAVAAVGDALRPDAKKSVQALQQSGWQVGILSGDQPQIVKNIGAQLEIDPDRCWGGLLPEDKVAIVQRSAQAGTVVMVGDGVNDSAALAAATVGIATHNGAEASLQAAPVYLGQPGLAGVLELIDASRSTMRAIRRNFAASLAYNIIGVGLAAAGWINPLVAAVLMPLSSLTVVSLSLTTRTFSRKRP